MSLQTTQLISDIKEIYDTSDYFFLISYLGLSVQEQEELRNNLKEVNQAVMNVHKNRLIKKASEGNQQLSDLVDLDLTGGTAIISGNGEPSISAKSIQKFGKKHEVVSFKGSFVEGRVLNKSESEKIASLPTKDEARAMLLRMFLAPSTQFVGVLSAKLRTILYVLNAIIEKKKTNGES